MLIESIMIERDSEYSRCDENCEVGTDEERRSCLGDERLQPEVHQRRRIQSGPENGFDIGLPS